MDLPDLYIIRHGETEWNAARRIQGQLNSVLNETGHGQAASMAQRMAAIALPPNIRLLVSPLTRAQQTADYIVKATGLEIETHSDLAEVHMGEWQGRYLSDLAAEGHGPQPDENHYMWCMRAPGGETLDDLWVRAARVLAGLNGPSILVCHGVLSRVLRTQAMGWGKDRLLELPGKQGDIYKIAGGDHSTL